VELWIFYHLNLSLNRLDDLPPPYGSDSSRTIYQRPPPPADLTGNIHSGCYCPRVPSRDHLSPRLYGVRSAGGGDLLRAITQMKGELTIFYLGIAIKHLDEDLYPFGPY